MMTLLITIDSEFVVEILFRGPVCFARVHEHPLLPFARIGEYGRHWVTAVVIATIPADQLLAVYLVVVRYPIAHLYQYRV